MKPLSFISLLLALFFPFCLFSQQNNSIEILIEEIAANSDEELDYSTIMYDLDDFLINPINLNTATYEELEKIHYLDDIQIGNVLKYRKKYGIIYSVYELNYIEGISKPDIELLLPFITIKAPEKYDDFSWRKALRYGQHKLYSRCSFILEEQKGFSSISDSALYENPNSRYLGNRLKLYNRYEFKYKDLVSCGITMDKDAGEEFFSGNLTKGFDFYSAFFCIKNYKFVKTFIIGDFQAQFGQGLTAFSGVGFGKSSLVNNIGKRARGLLKYSSANENEFFRGIATTLSVKNFDISIFASRKTIDANLVTVDTDSTQKVFSSFQTSGYHRIPSEIVDKDAVSETVLGANISWSKNNFNCGVTCIHYCFDAELQKTQKYYNLFEFEGNANSNLSFDYHYRFRNISVFGEASYSANSGYAIINGAGIQLIPKAAISVLYRNYQPGYQSLYSNAFGENSKTANEKGFYIGFSLIPADRWEVSAYYDAFEFPWLKYGVNAPSRGNELFIQTNYTTSKNLGMYWRVKSEQKQENTSETENQLNQIGNTNKLSFRYHISYRVLKSLELRNRIEWVKYTSADNVSETGILVFQDVIFDLNAKISFRSRFAVFDTDSYSSRLYAYENDVLYAFSVPACYSEGIRTYLLCRYKITKNMNAWLRLARTRYSDMDVISSGLSEIDGNTKTEVKAQIRIRF